MKKTDHHLVQQVLDGDVTREVFDGFQQRLRDEPELLRLYGDYALLQHTLSEEFEGGHVPEHGVAMSCRRLFGIPVLWATAALLAIAGAILWFQPFAGPDKGDDVAAVTFSVDAVWQLEGASRNLGGATGVDRGCKLRLLQGRAGISLEPAVTAVIEGPADVTFLGKDSLHLSQGRGFFSRGGTGGGLTITTPKLTAIDSGTEFGIEVPVAGPEELHVMEGKVQVVSKTGNERALLVAGDAVRVPVTGSMERFAAGGRHFATGLGRFRSVLSGPFKRADWRLEFGYPSFADNRIEGANYTAFLQFDEPQPAGENSVLLATIEVGEPVGGEFHTDGWAGISFFSNRAEVLFFGDSFGTKPTWSLDVKQRTPAILPDQALTGPRTVTLRYDSRSGEVSLHEGGVPLKMPFCVGNLPVATRFDEIRIGASAGAALTVNSLHVRVGGE